MLKKILLTAALVTAASAAQADSFSVYVGYTDNLRPSGFFPSPFCTGNTTTCQVDTKDAGVLDGGAFRIDNTGATSLDITNIKVTLGNGAYAFTLWNNVTIGVGARGIFGQPTPSQDFDTSDTYDFFPSFSLGEDFGIGVNGIGGCTVLSDLSTSQQATCKQNDPVITFDVNGTPESFTDTGSIINTGGYDYNCCSDKDGNESIDWNLVGTTGTRGGDIPEPITLTVFGAGLAGAAALRRRKKTKA